MVALFALTLPALAGELTLSAFGGTSFSARTPLTIEQAGQPTIRFTARYDTRPIDDWPYYAWRVGLWSGSSSWELQHIHHKIYLSNTTDEVQRFEITHGYNLFTLGRAFRTPALTWRVGLGAVVTHGRERIRSEDFETGGVFGEYQVAGVSAIAGVEKDWKIASRVFVATELQVSGAWARVEVPRGDATVPNVALHALVGLQVRLGRS